MYPPASQPMHLYTQAMSTAQTAWGYESVGNGYAAGQLYQQAVQLFTGCVQMLGAQAPDVAFYHLGLCQVRLGWLCSTGGNLMGARQWLEVALPNLQAAWQRNPAQLCYQATLAQTAQLLGRADLVAHVYGQTPKPRPTARPADSLPDKLNQGLDTFKKWQKFFGSLAGVVGKATGGQASDEVADVVPAEGASTGGSWTDGSEAGNGWCMGGMDWNLGGYDMTGGYDWNANGGTW